MIILYVHQFYAGPDAPGPAQPRRLVQRLAERGHTVMIVAGDFNAYSEQDEPEEFHEYPSGGSVRVYRLKTPRNIRARLRNRLKSYGHFAWNAWRYGRKLARPDMVLATIQPLFSGWAALRLARRWHCPFMLEVRDLWPDALVVKKAIAPWQAALLQAMARHLYFGANRVVSLTPGIKQELLAKGVSAKRLDVFPNGFDAGLYELGENSRAEIRARYGWENSFVAVYTGTHVEVTAIDVIVRAAAVLQDRTDIRIDLFGSGQSKSAAMALAQELGLRNIHFHDPVPKSQVPAILAAADAGLMTLFRSPLIHIYFENKFIDYMGARLPVLASMDGVQAELIRQHRAGCVVATLDHDALAAAIAHAADHPEERRNQGEAGYALASQRLNQRVILDRYADTIEALPGDGGEGMDAWDPFVDRLGRGRVTTQG